MYQRWFLNAHFIIIIIIKLNSVYWNGLTTKRRHWNQVATANIKLDKHEQIFQIFPGPPPPYGLNCAFCRRSRSVLPAASCAFQSLKCSKSN